MRVQTATYGALALLLTVSGEAWGGTAADEILVSPCGLSLLDARNRIRAERKAGDVRSRTVRLKAGAYRLAETLTFGPEDSHVKYVADGDVTITGSRRLDGWSVEPDGSWSAAVDWVKEDRTGGFRMLRVNGVMCPRARLPKRGYFTVVNDDLPEGAPWNAVRPSFFYDPKEFNPQWKNLSDAEIVCYHFWIDSHLRIASVNAESNKVTLVTPCKLAFDTGWSNNKSGGLRGIYVVENIPAAMTDPGEWWLEHTARRLHYRPKPGEDPATAVVEVPFVRTLVSLKGSPLNDGRYVEDITFQGIRFNLSQYELGPDDTNNGQGASGVAAAVVLAGARNCRFEHCTFEDLSGYAAEVLEGARDNVFSRCTMTRLGAGGVRLNGGAAGCSPIRLNSGTVVTDCEIGSYGRDFRSAVGVLLMNAEKARIVHNHIFDGWYTGISAGWVWGYYPSVSRQNEISHNHIHKIGQGCLSDMGGIYTLGPSFGTRIANNRIHDVDARSYGGWGIYNDEGSTGILIENNVVYDTKFAGYDIHYAKDIIVRNNIFALGRMDQLARTRQESHVSCEFYSNIVYWTEGRLHSGNWKDLPNKVTFRSEANVYFNPGIAESNVVFGDNMSFEAWRKMGKDRASIYADPLFVDVKSRDFRLKPNSPALGLGFVDFDQSDVGPSMPRSEGGTDMDGSVVFKENPVSGGLDRISISGDPAGMNWILQSDGSQYPWIRERCAWGLGTLKVEAGGRCSAVAWTNPVARVGSTLLYRPHPLLEVSVKRECEAGDLVERYVFRNVSAKTCALSEIDINTPFNDNYPSAQDCLLGRCNAHLWPGGSAAYVCATRMSGNGPHLGLTLTEGDLSAYEIKERTPEKGGSNFRGVICLSPADRTLAPGESFAVEWRIYAHRGWEDFFAQHLKRGGVLASADRYVGEVGEKIVVTLRSADGELQRKELKLLEPGEKKVGLSYGTDGRCFTWVEILAISNIRKLLEKRANYILSRQQFVEPGNPRSGAFLAYDTQKKRQIRIWEQANPRIEFREGCERCAMGVFLAEYVGKVGDVTGMLKPALANYRKFTRTALQDPDYKTWGEYRRGDSHRIYNYPWLTRLYLDLFSVTHDRQDLADAYGTQMAAYREGGYGFYMIDVPVYESIRVLKANGMQTEADELLAEYRKAAECILAHGPNVPPHEVTFEQTIIAPAFGFLTELYRVTGERRYLEGARRMLSALESFNGHQPSWHLNDIAIRHWDGYWGGLNLCFGDTLPHFWSAVTADCFGHWSKAVGDERYLARAKAILHQNLGLLHEDGSGTAAIVYPDRINGRPAKSHDPLANDQDYAAAYFVRWCLE